MATSRVRGSAVPRLICLFGGTFDPVHYGHLRPLQELQQIVAADAIYIIPAAIPPHRPAPQATSAQRVKMLELALQEFPGFELDTLELQRAGPSWTVDTLQSFRQRFPDHSLCLVMGSDAFAGLPSWYHWQELLELAHIIVIQRAEMKNIKIPEWAVPHLVTDVALLRKQRASSIFSVSVKEYDISATEIRQRLAAGREVKGLLPEQVITYIEGHNLYLADERDGE